MAFIHPNVLCRSKRIFLSPRQGPLRRNYPLWAGGRWGGNWKRWPMLWGRGSCSENGESSWAVIAGGGCVPPALSPGGDGHFHRVVCSTPTHAQAQNKPSIKIQVSFHEKKNQKIYLNQILDWSKMLKVGRSLFWHPMMDSPVFMNCWFSPVRMCSFSIFQQAANIN